VTAGEARLAPDMHAGYPVGTGDAAPAVNGSDDGIWYFSAKDGTPYD